MKVSKAIEILNYDLPYYTRTAQPDTVNAIKLGIEALKRHQKAITGFANPNDYLLPGETPENEK